MLALALGGRARGEEALLVVRANSPRIDVQDGNRLLRGIWNADPKTDLDVYYARRGKGERTVTFRTDVDSISFDVAPGGHYDFVVLLNGKDRCGTRVSTMREPCRKEGAPGALAEDAIPFAIGRDNKIHLAGWINDSETLDLLLDLGADTEVLFPSGAAKNAKLRLDGTTENAGTGGVVTRPTSNDNRIALGALRWDHESILSIEKQSDRADGILGYNLFDDKVIELDYDAMVLRVSDALPERTKGASTLPIRFRGTLPAVAVRFEIPPAPSFEEWLVLDTGSSLSVHLNRGAAEKHALHGSMKLLGSSTMGGTGPAKISNGVMLLPRLAIGDQELHDVPLHVEEGSGVGQEPGGHLGMDALKRFDTVVDFRNDVAYLTPSALHGDSYRVDYHNDGWKIVAAVASLLLLAGGILRLRRRA
jgi:hypothetical protein